MENENHTVETVQEEDWFQREERCRKNRKTVFKAICMRLFVTVLLIWILLQTSMEPWIVGLMIFVMIINVTGLFPLVSEWRKRNRELKAILAEEE
ncbi:MAG: hypothetical protein IJB59_02360 [Oscillospiraceae bacterium]|nr:hypothetical protein [Oscillospiraceae bacterium]